VSTREQALEILWLDRAWHNQVDHFLRPHNTISDHIRNDQNKQAGFIEFKKRTVLE
jgi:hypothetical protein